MALAGSASAGGVAGTPNPLEFDIGGDAVLGSWKGSCALSPQSWTAGGDVRLSVLLSLGDGHLQALEKDGAKADEVCVLATAERTFDAAGRMHFAGDERMSTLLTPTGLAIEGGANGAVTTRFGGPFASPLDLFACVPVSAGKSSGTATAFSLALSGTLPKELPPGIYRVRIDPGIRTGKRLASLGNTGFAQRTPRVKEMKAELYSYSPTIPVSGKAASGASVDARSIKRRVPWVLFEDQRSNGSRGIVADEDAGQLALSERNIIADDAILPRFDDSGHPRAYSLEPQFPVDANDPEARLGLDSGKGELRVVVSNPDGATVDLGTASFVAALGSGLTTANPAFTRWQPPMYGSYSVLVRGWVSDRQGNRYEGGGTYHFWVGKRMTVATAVFEGMPFPVGSRYGRDIQFFPAVPAEVTVTAELFVGSDPSRIKTVRCGGRASAAGVFGMAQGLKALPLDAPGEYRAHILATYTDSQGHLWVASMRHGGVVYPPGTPIIAHGKRLRIEKQFVDRGETHKEGVEASTAGPRALEHINFPYNARDVLLIASEGTGANKIEPVLTYSQGGIDPDDGKVASIGATNVAIQTSNGYAPHLFPEYITSMEYYYAAAPRPGFMSRFLVGENIVRAPYWPTSRTDFGGQIGASPGGDRPGDIYRLLGGVVLRRRGEEPLYAGYIASAMILPGGSKDNRVVAPGSEDLVGPVGKAARFFLAGIRPGTAFEQGALLTPVAQVDPILPARVRFELAYPDGRSAVSQGACDAFGIYVGAEHWKLDVPGLYRFRLQGDWEGHRGETPGLPQEGGYLYVLGKRPAQGEGLALESPDAAVFDPSTPLTIRGRSRAKKVYFSAIMPGAVLAQGELPVRNGWFSYVFDGEALRGRVPIYETGKPANGRVVHLSLFSNEKASDGSSTWDLKRVILRGNHIVQVE